MADTYSMSVASGGTQILQLFAGHPHGGEPYLLLGSLSGTAPGQTVDGHVLPLNLDAYFLHTVSMPNAPPLTGSFGLLSTAPFPGSKATAAFTLPRAFDPILVGLTVEHAYATLDLSTGRVNLTSNPVPLALVP